MTGLAGAISETEAVVRRLSRRPPERAHVERAAANLSEHLGEARARLAEEDEAFLSRMRSTLGIRGTLEGARPRELARLCDMVWGDGDLALANQLLRSVLDANRTRLDRPLIEAYLRRYPTESPTFAALRAAANMAAARHPEPAWPWRYRAERFGMLRAEGASHILARAVLQEGPAVLTDAGLAGELASGRFANAVMRRSCEVTLADPDQERAAQRLIRLASHPGMPRAPIVRALLKPWTNRRPSVDLQRRITSALVSRFGDPRIERTRWQSIEDEVKLEFGHDSDAGTVVRKLRSWLVETAVNQFLDVVDYDADPQQWPFRKAFWLSYLDRGYIDDAWVAFGPDAAIRARQLTEESDGGHKMFAGLSGGYQPSQSVLLMKIGDLTVGDWSHTGRCRFWRAGSKAGQWLQTPDGSWRDAYSAFELRRLEKGDTELPHPGAATYAWQVNFNELIGELTDYRVWFDCDVLYPREHFSKWNPRNRRP